MKELTKAEEQIMHILWDIKKGFVNDILNKLAEPKPAYNTVSTVVRILEKKGFVGHNAFGKTHEYFPIIAKEDYTRQFMGNIVKGYFDNSFRKMVSFFTGNGSLSLKEMEEIRRFIDKQIEHNKTKIDD